MTFGYRASLLKRACGLSWREVARALSLLLGEEVKYSRARSAARDWESRHDEDLSRATCPAEYGEIIAELRAGQAAPTDATPVAGDAATFVVDGNEAELTVTSRTPIKTLAELIESHQIDTDVWTVSGKVLHNTWTTPAFNKKTEKWTYFQNHQVKAPFVKLDPEPLHPQIQPITPLAVHPAPQPARTAGDVWREVICGDAHIGYFKDPHSASLSPLHDRRALDLTVQIIAELQPQRVHMLGDMLDAAELSDKYPREPRLLFTLQPALAETYWWWHDIRTVVPDAEAYYHEGNHEERLQRWLVAHFPAVYELKRADAMDLPPVLSFENLIALDALQVSWIAGYPQDEAWSADLRLRHGDVARSKPGTTGWAILQDADGDEAYGHIHRQELVTKTIYHRRGRREARAFCPGCLCHVDGRVPGSSPDDYWQQGLVVRDFLPDGKLATETFVSIQDGHAICEGQLYRARDRLGEIREAFPDFQWS